LTKTCRYSKEARKTVMKLTVFSITPQHLNCCQLAVKFRKEKTNVTAAFKEGGDGGDAVENKSDDEPMEE
jgi:hypothetical protein